MKALCVALAIITSLGLAVSAVKADETEKLPQPIGCTEGGTLTESTCSKGEPVYLPNGETISFVEVLTTVQPKRSPETEAETRASLNLQIVVLPDGSTTDIEPMFLRVTLPGQEEQKMNVDEDKYGFIQAAKNAVEQWRYVPAKLNGEPVAVYSSVCIEFKPASEVENN